MLVQANAFLPLLSLGCPTVNDQHNACGPVTFWWLSFLCNTFTSRLRLSTCTSVYWSHVRMATIVEPPPPFPQAVAVWVPKTSFTNLGVTKGWMPGQCLEHCSVSFLIPCFCLVVYKGPHFVIIKKSPKAQQCMDHSLPRIPIQHSCLVLHKGPHFVVRKWTAKWKSVPTRN